MLKRPFLEEDPVDDLAKYAILNGDAEVLKFALKVSGESEHCRSTHLFAICLSYSRPCKVLLSKPIKLTLDEVEFLVMHSSASSLRTALANPALCTTTYKLQNAFSFCMGLNVLSPYSAQELLSKGVVVSERDLVKCLEFVNTTLFKVLAQHCRKWRPLKMFEVLSCPLCTARSKTQRLNMVRYIATLLEDSEFQCTVDGDPDNFASYKVNAGFFTWSGLGDRCCK